MIRLFDAAPHARARQPVRRDTTIPPAKPSPHASTPPGEAMISPFLPKKLISFRNLQGGQYGTLDVTVREPSLVELALGGDYIWLTPDQWIALRSVIDPVFGLETERETVVVASDAKGHPIVIEEVERVVTRKRAPARPPRKQRAARA